MRRKRETPLEKAGRDVPFPGWETLESEKRQEAPQIWLTVADSEGRVVRRVQGPVTAGFHRVAWDLRYPAPEVVEVSPAEASVGQSSGLLAAPGSYTVTLSKQVDGVVTPLSAPQPFDVVPLRKGALEGAPHTEVAVFWRAVDDATRQNSALVVMLREALNKSVAIGTALMRTPARPGDFDARLHEIRQRLLDLDGRLNGPAAKREVGEKTRPTIGARLFSLTLGVGRSTYGPTVTNRRGLEIIQAELGEMRTNLESVTSRLSALAKELLEAGGPSVEGEALPE
jgi:hypothetical protein